MYNLETLSLSAIKIRLSVAPDHMRAEAEDGQVSPSHLVIYKLGIHVLVIWTVRTC
jgi:hypothetical protein